MKNFWKEKWGREHICGITHTRLRPGKDKYGNSYVVELPCTHRFYRKPLITWVESCFTRKTDVVCPMCRQGFDHYII